MVKRIFLNKPLTSTKDIVYFANIKSFNYKARINELPKERMERFLKFSFEDEKKRFVAVWILLKKAFKMQNLNIDEYRFTYDEKGKPLLVDSPVNFSISHSGNYVAVILSFNDVGIDVQKKQKVSQNLINFTCNSKDLIFMKNSKNKNDAFFTIWCLKESYSKMIGNGLIISPRSIEIEYKNIEKNHRFWSFNFVKGYKMGTFSSKNVSVLIKKVSIH